MSRVDCLNVRKDFQEVQVLRDVSLQVESGEFLVLVGPSGCGKSTLLRILAGLETPTAGEVHIDGRNVTSLEPRHRDLAMVFQNYALYPHLSVFENLAFGLKLQGLARDEIRRRVDQVSSILQIQSFLERRPRELSGGQRQRVALGRALVRKTKLILFDEPLSNLDAALRAQMRYEIKRLHGLTQSTMIYVTHDQVEATTLGDRIAILNKGVIEQLATAKEIYERPANHFVAGFIGTPEMNFLPGQVLGKPDLDLGVRPEDVVAGEGPFEARFELQEYMGSHYLVHATLQGQALRLLSDQARPEKPGQNLRLNFSNQKIHAFDKQSGKRVALA